MAFLGAPESCQSPHKLTEIDLLNRHSGVLPAAARDRERDLSATKWLDSLVSEESLNNPGAQRVNCKLRNQHQVLSTVYHRCSRDYTLHYNIVGSQEVSFASLVQVSETRIQPPNLVLCN